jgi:DNA repair REX1-B
VEASLTVYSTDSLHSGLEEVLISGNLSRYPNVCAEATASFSVLSETINSARRILDEKHSDNENCALIARLQKAEREKLNLTAALHLEKIRADTQRQLDEQQQEEDTRIALLLAQGVASLQQKIARTVEEINETLEELRCAWMEECE